MLVSPLVSLLALLCLHLVLSVLNSIVLTANWLSLRVPIPSPGLIQLGPEITLALASYGPGDERVDVTFSAVTVDQGVFFTKRIEIIISSAASHGALTFLILTSINKI